METERNIKLQLHGTNTKYHPAFILIANITSYSFSHQQSDSACSDLVWNPITLILTLGF